MVKWNELIVVASFIFLAILQSSICFGDDSALDVGEVEKQILANRQRIISGHFVVKVKTIDNDQTRTGTYEIFMDRDRYRIDSRTKRSEDAPEIYRSGVLRGEEVLFYTDENPAPGVTIVATRKPLRPSTVGRKGIPSFPAPAIQYLGLNTVTLLNLRNEDFAGLVGNMRSVLGTSTQLETLPEGDSLIRLVYTRKIGDAEVWIDPERNYEIVKIEKDYEKSFRKITTTLQKVKGFGFFPETFYLQENRNKPSGPFHRTQRGEVEVISINEPLDDELFTMKSMRVPIGHRVDDLVDKKILEMAKSGPVVPAPNAQTAAKRKDGRGEHEVETQSSTRSRIK